MNVDTFKRLHQWPALAALGVVVVDQLTKLWAVAALRPADVHSAFSRQIVVIPGCLSFRYAENTGAAFSLFAAYPKILTILSLIIAAAILVWYWKTPVTHTMTRIALALVWGGAVGNLIDRFVRGSVVDFILAYWRSYYWPTFNVADSAICVGIGVLILWSHREQIRG